MTAPTTEARPELIEWQHCYDSSWKGLITPESFAHPAKFSRDLIERILDHCLARGYLRPGDVVGDPFGGIGTGGIAAAYRGLRWVGVELEGRFVDFARANFELHRSKWAVLGAPAPQIIQGDSRRFHELVSARAVAGNVDAVVASPPFSGPNMQPKTCGQDLKRNGEGRIVRPVDGHTGDRTLGNIETLKEGSVDACISSPPYSETLNHGGGPDTKQDILQGGKSLMGIKDGYGESAGQIGHLKAGSVDGVVSSPPFEDSLHQRPGQMLAPQQSTDDGKPEDYWRAVNKVYRSCWQAIKPGGVIVLVVKDYVKNGKRVPLCDDTARLLEHVGFTVAERIRAMLIKETHHNDLFDGRTTSTKSRKSFFRRLAEKKGSPAIDFEEVLIARKP